MKIKLNKNFVDDHLTTKLYCVYDTVEEKYVINISHMYSCPDPYDKVKSYHDFYDLKYAPAPEPSASSEKIETIENKLLYFSSFTENKLVIRVFSIDINYENLSVDSDIFNVSKLIYNTCNQYSKPDIVGKNIMKLLKTDLEKSNRYAILITILYNMRDELNSNVKKIFKTKPAIYFKKFDRYGYMLLTNDIKSLGVLKLLSDTIIEIKIIDRTTNTFVEL